MLAVVSQWLAVVCLVYLARLAWLDFLCLKIRNKAVAVLLALSLLHWLIRPNGLDWQSLAAALLLLSLGFGFWVFRMMGAGDAKLFVPLGVMIGWDQLYVFAVALIPASLATLLIFWSVRTIAPVNSEIGERLEHLARLRGVPYAVPLFFATSVAMLPWILLL